MQYDPVPLHESTTSAVASSQRLWARYLSSRPLPRRLSTIDGQAIPEAWIIDLSAGGIGLLVDAPQAVGSQLRVELEACPQAAPVRAVATVMHCQPTDGEYRLGCRFTTPLTESDLQVLLQ